MTREKALEELKEIRFNLNYKVNGTSRFDEALNMAIKALKQQDKVLDAIKEIRDLLKQPAAYVPNYDAYKLCLSIICKYLEVEDDSN